MRNVDAMYDRMFFHTSYAVERSLTPFYDVDGLTYNLQNNEEFQCALEKMKIEAELPNIPIPVQLFMIGSQTAILTHQLNKERNSRVMEEATPVAPPPSETSSVDENTKTRLRKEIPVGGRL